MILYTVQQQDKIKRNPFIVFDTMDLKTLTISILFEYYLYILTWLFYDITCLVLIAVRLLCRNL
jgi:hypothetical protein